VSRVAPTIPGLEPGQPDPAEAGAVANEVVLRVEDTGRGIPPDVVPHIFEPFFTTKEMGRGTGLGLSMVDGIVRQSGGRTEVATGSGGTAMIIRLPLASAMPGPAPVRPSVERPVEGARILLVDDDPVVRAIARRILAHAGFEVLEAADAAQARAHVDAAHRPIDLLVTDIIMPGMRGPELARLLHESEPGLPVLFVSGYAGEDALDGLEPGRVAYLAKPFSIEALLEAVRELLQGRDAGAAEAGAPDRGGVARP
jgi:two-component system cell cycle sensor histidine kinase/response regulator CckA